MRSINIQPVLKSPWIIALILLGVFLLSTGYEYGWDDQHLEIPLLKSLIDPTLYVGDYYVQSLKVNFSSFFYPILARLITVKQIPAAYFILYLLSRYFLFFWIYKLWLLLTKDSFKAITCVMVFILIARVDEFLYRTFSHQEFALAIIFSGIYYFFKERFILAAILFGLAANIHGLYSLFPMLFMGIYLLWQIKNHGIKTLIKTSSAFLICALPFIIWTLKVRIVSHSELSKLTFTDWMSLYIMACPQNFFLPHFPRIPLGKLVGNINVLFYATQFYLLLIVLFGLNIIFNPYFKSNKKAIAFSLSAFGLLLIALIFTYFYPTRFFLDLNLTRNTQFLSFLLMGFTTIFIIDTIESKKYLIAFALGLLFACLKYNTLLTIAALITIGLITLIEEEMARTKPNRILLTVYTLAMLACLYRIYFSFNAVEYKLYVRLILSLIFTLLTINYFIYPKINQRYSLIHKRLFVIIPLALFLCQFTYYHYSKVKAQKEGKDFWGLQNSWVDMQKFVKAHTPKDAIIMVPYNMEMGGFRILSERRLVVCYRDCGIIGFDYPAAIEWVKRINDIRPFTYNMNTQIGPAVQKGIIKYKADYVVFLRYASPKENTGILEKVYVNKYFALYKIIMNPELKSLQERLAN